MKTQTIQLYQDGMPAGQVEVPEAAILGAQHLAAYLHDHPGATIAGMGDVVELQCQLAEVTKERDQLKAALELADALRNRERGMSK